MLLWEGLRMKKIVRCGIVLFILLFALATAEGAGRVEAIVKGLQLKAHPEGGWFSEVYTSPVVFPTPNGSRALSGSIYYLLGKQEKSSFHEIDCDEIWYYHEGCGMRVYILSADGPAAEVRLGCDISQHESPMVVVPAGSIFAAENIDPEGYTLISCLTTPKFRYEGWRLVPKAELLLKYPGSGALIQHFAD